MRQNVVEFYQLLFGHLYLCRLAVELHKCCNDFLRQLHVTVFCPALIYKKIKNSLELWQFVISVKFWQIPSLLWTVLLGSLIHALSVFRLLWRNAVTFYPSPLLILSELYCLVDRSPIFHRVHTTILLLFINQKNLLVVMSVNNKREIMLKTLLLPVSVYCRLVHHLRLIKSHYHFGISTVFGPYFITVIKTKTDSCNRILRCISTPHMWQL